MRRHGTHSCYVSGCRCPRCAEANREYAKARERAKAREAFNGGAFRVPPEDTARQLRKLLDKGWSCREIARATGIAKNSLQNIRNMKNKNGGRLEYISRDTAERLAAFAKEPRHKRKPCTLVDAAPYLVALGAWRRVFTFPELSELTGLSVTTLHNIWYHQGDKMRAATALAIRKAAGKVDAAFAEKTGRTPAKQPKTWAEIAREREAAGFVVNPYR